MRRKKTSEKEHNTIIRIILKRNGRQNKRAASTTSSSNNIIITININEIENSYNLYAPCRISHLILHIFLIFSVLFFFMKQKKKKIHILLNFWRWFFFRKKSQHVSHYYEMYGEVWNFLKEEVGHSLLYIMRNFIQIIIRHSSAVVKVETGFICVFIKTKRIS